MIRPLRIAGVRPIIYTAAYVLVAGLWIVLSDDLVAVVFKDAQAITIASTLKGFLFLTVSGTLVFVGLSRWDEDRRLAAESLKETRRAWDQSLDALPISVLTTDASGIIVRMNHFGASTSGYRPADVAGKSVLEITSDGDRALIQQCIDRARRGELVEAQARIRHADGTIVPYRFQASAVVDASGRPVSLIAAGIDITDEIRARNRLSVEFDSLQGAIEQTVGAVSKMIEKRDAYTAGHQERVTRLALAIASRMGMESERLRGLRVAGLCHDIGKINIPAEILNKPNHLTPEEYAIVRGHSQTGYEILHEIDFPWPVAEIVRQHHERLDGSGYPRGLKGDQIRLEARIIAVADVVESMMHYRPYREPLGLDAALAEVEHGRGQLYDPAIVDACVAAFRQDGFVLNPPPVERATPDSL